MKIMPLGVLSLFLMTSSFSAFADKIIVTGEPVELEQSGDTYVVPSTLKPSQEGFYYVKIGGKVNACYLSTQPALVKLTPENVAVKIQDEKVTWSCYPLDPTYFVVPNR